MKKERYTYKGITIEAVPLKGCRNCYFNSRFSKGTCNLDKIEQFRVKDCVLGRNKHVHFEIVKPHKLSDKELMIRKFRKFLYDNDVLELWYKNVKSSRWESTPRHIFAKCDPNDWICKAFPWPHIEYHTWNLLNEIWDYTINKTK